MEATVGAGGPDSKKYSVSDNETKIKSSQKRFEVDAQKLSPMILDIRQKLDDYVVGQDLAKDEIVDALAKNLMVDPARKTPIATLIMVGPTGVGKTEIVRALYKILFGNDLIDINQCKIDCNAYADKYDVAGLVGANVGLVGREQTPILSDKVLFKAFNKALKEGTLHPILSKYENFSILLLDEIEKAHPVFHDLFLGIMDEGILELKNGAEEGEIGKTERSSDGGNNVKDYNKTTNFRNVLIIMTSNLGAEDIQNKLNDTGTMGFIKDGNSVDEILSVEYYTKMVKSSKIFKPEFIGRITSLIPFKPLTQKEFYQRLYLSIKNHNKVFKDKEIKLSLTGKAKKYLVETSIATNEGGRSLIKMFEHDIYTKFVRVYNNGEIERIEEKSGHPVKVIQIGYKNEKYVVELLINENKKALSKERKQELILESKMKKFDQQEKIISLKDESFLITFRDIYIPNLKRYRALLKHKDGINVDYEIELVAIKNILNTFAFQPKDYEILEAEDINSKFEDIDSKLDEMSAILLWNEDKKNKLFSGMLKFITDFITNYFDDHKDLNTLVSGGAGKLSDAMLPIKEHAEKIVNRGLTYDEETYILVTFHEEFIKLNSTVAATKQIPYKNKEENKTKQTKTNKDENKSVTININFNSDGNNQTDWEDKLKNLFQNDFEFVMLAIRQNVADKKVNDDIIDIMNNIKIELEKQFDLNSNKTTTITEFVQKLLKDEDLLN